jgi:hypothetical protein
MGNSPSPVARVISAAGHGKKVIVAPTCGIMRALLGA